MPYSTPPNFATGAVLTEAQLDTLSDDIAFLANPPKVRAYNSQDATIAAGANFTFDSETTDTDTMHSTTTNTERITFNTAGTYLIVARLLANLAASTVHFVTLYHQRGGSATTLDTDEKPNSTTLFTSYKVTALYTVQAGDYVYLKNDGAGGFPSRALRGAPTIEAAWVGF